MYIIICETDRQSRFDAWDRVLRVGTLGWPRGMRWGGRFRMGNTCTPVADSCQCMAKPIQYGKVISLQNKRKILNDDAVKMLHSICQHIWKTPQWSQDWKMLFFIPIPKNVQTLIPSYTFHMVARSCSKSFKLGLSSRWTKSFQYTCWI